MAAKEQLTLGEQLRLLRKKAGLTQEQLADKIGKKRLSIVHWESDLHEPSAANLKSLSEFYKVDIVSLMKSSNVKQFPKGAKGQNAYAVFSGLLQMVWGFKDSASDRLLKDALKDLEDNIRRIMSERFGN